MWKKRKRKKNWLVFGCGRKQTTGSVFGSSPGEMMEIGNGSERKKPIFLFRDAQFRVPEEIPLDPEKKPQNTREAERSAAAAVYPVAFITGSVVRQRNTRVEQVTRLYIGK